MPLTSSMHRPLLVILAMLAMLPCHAATITVTTVADNSPPITNGVCSLREALANASNDAATYPDCPAGTGDDVITFGNHLFTAGNQYTATINLAGRLVAGTPTGTARSLVIRPPLPAGGNSPRVRLVASTGLPYAILDILPTAKPFTAERINIEGGRGSNRGGGVRLLSEDATFNGVHFLENEAKGGGALHQLNGNGKLRIVDSLFLFNIAMEGIGGAILLESTNPAHQVSIVNSRFQSNHAYQHGGAIGFSVNTSFSGSDTPLLEIVRSQFDRNTSYGAGGGVYASAEANADQRMSLRIHDSLFWSNESGAGGNGLFASGHPLDDQGSVEILRSSFINNTSPGNTSGGGVFARDLHLYTENTLFAGNRARSGGSLAYYASASSLPHTLSLIGNSFQRYTLTGTQSGRFLYLQLPANASAWEWTVAGNLFDAPPAENWCVLLGGLNQLPTLRGGNNLSSESSCLFLGAADIQANPMTELRNSDNPLTPLLLLPQPGSPAIDAWPAETCTNHLDQPLDHDLRHAPRPIDGDNTGTADCDIGAFELTSADTDPIFADGFEG